MTPNQRFRFGVASLLAVAATITCSGDNLILPADGMPATIAIVTGDGQADTVGGTLQDTLIVRLTDSKDRPIQSQVVTFTALLNGSGARLIPDTALTNADGQAKARWVLGPVSGRQTVRAQVGGLGASSPLFVDLSATAAAGAPDTLVLVNGDSQYAVAGSQLGQPLVVGVTDQFGNPINGIMIGWTPLGGGTASASTTSTGTDGQASVQRTLGPIAGVQGATATAAGLKGSPLTFTHTAGPGQPVALLADSGNGQGALPGLGQTIRLVVRLVDANGNGVPGPAVSWAVATGGGIVTPTSGIMDSTGRAATIWTLGPAGGPNSVIAAAAGFSVTFTATGSVNPGPPALVTITVQPSALVQNTTALPTQPVVQVQDASGNLLDGVAVTAAIASGGGVLSGSTSVLTTAGGVATFTNLSLTGTVGSRTLAFTAGAASATSAAITVTPGPPIPARSTATVPSGTAGSPTTITVQAKDASDNLTTGGATVTVNVSGANAASPAVTDNHDGTYSAAYTPTSAGTDDIAIALGGSGISGSPYHSAILAGAVSASRSMLQVSAASITASTGSSGSTVTVTAEDAFGNIIGGAAVAFAATGSNNTFSPATGTTNPSGQAASNFSSTASGSKTISARINGVTLAQSQAVMVNPDVADPKQTTANVPNNGRQRRPTVIRVQTRDQFGNNLTIGGHTVVVTVTGANTDGPNNAGDNGDGSYTASYVPSHKGTDTIAITLDGVPIKGSPYTSKVH